MISKKRLAQYRKNALETMTGEDLSDALELLDAYENLNVHLWKAEAMAAREVRDYMHSVGGGLALERKMAQWDEARKACEESLT